MTNNNSTKHQLDAGIETLVIAFRALLDALPPAQASQVRSNISKRIDDHLMRNEPVNETNPYALRMRSFAAALLQDGPEQPVFGD